MSFAVTVEPGSSRPPHPVSTADGTAAASLTTAQVGPPHAAGVRPISSVGHGVGQARLADAARAGEGHEAVGAQHVDQLGDLGGPADQRRELCRQVVAERVERAQRGNDRWIDGWSSCQTCS